MSTDYDEIRSEELQWEAEQDRFYEAIEEQLNERKIEDLVQSVKEGYDSCKDMLGELIFELDKLEINSHPQSFAFLSLTLLEVVERDLLFFPLLLSSKSLLNDENGAINELIREAVGRNANTTAFVCKLYLHGENDFDVAKKEFDSIIAEFVPSHKHFKPQNSPTRYREDISANRNAIFHGKKFSTVEEAKFLYEFANAWREKVFNPILHKYGFELNDNWELV